jgi:hypothetical protein
MAMRSKTPTEPVLFLAWLVLLAAVLSYGYQLPQPDSGDFLTRATVRLALLYYATSVALMLTAAPAEWPEPAGRARLARVCWTLGWLVFLVHLGMAFHYYHHWSHSDAVARTEEVSGFGPGVFVSYFFTLVWTCDITYWWVRPARYAGRARWLGPAVHGFMAFMVFNATVVYETGFIRWAGGTGLAALASLAVHRWYARFCAAYVPSSTADAKDLPWQ